MHAGGLADEAGAHAAAHSHPHEQIFWMLKGRMDFRLGNETRSCGPGDVCVIPGGVEHEAWFPEDTEVVDIFSPAARGFPRRRRAGLYAEVDGDCAAVRSAVVPAKAGTQ